MITYSFLDASENVGIPVPQKNAGLYSGEEVPHKHPRYGGNDYSEPRVQPDAIAYSQKFYEGAKNHIPTAVRLGNNTMINNPYNVYDDKYNSLCYRTIYN